MISRSDCQIMTMRSTDPAVRRSCYLRIAAAVLERAARDATSSDAKRAAEARRWLAGSAWARELIEVVDSGMDRRSVLAWIGELEPLRQQGLAL